MMEVKYNKLLVEEFKSDGIRFEVDVEIRDGDWFYHWVSNRCNSVKETMPELINNTSMSQAELEQAMTQIILREFIESKKKTSNDQHKENHQTEYNEDDEP